MHGLTFLQDLAVVMIVAGVVTVIFHRFKQPVVLGYIMAGVIMGPHPPPFPLIRDEQTIHTLAELGVIFLMFALGLEFNLRKLKKVGATAFIAAALEILLMVWLGYEIGRLFGWKTMDCIFLGAILSISSTTIIVKTLQEIGRTKERFSELIFGILIVEDILAIVMLALLSGIAMTGTLQLSAVALTVGRLAIFLVVALVLGLLAVPRLLGYVAKFKSNEMLLIVVLGLCFGVSLLAVKLDYSVALGAFIIGAVISEAREIGRIETVIEPVRDMFSAVFFVAVGLLIDPALLVRYALPITVITFVVVVGKVLTCSFGTFLAGHDTRTSLRVGMGLAQIGEFSFIIAALGLTLNVTSEFLYPIAVTVSAITTLLTPYLIKNADGWVRWFDQVAPPSVVNALNLYSRWIGQLGEGQARSAATPLIHKWAWQMGLNIALVAAVFLSAGFVAQKRPAWLQRVPGGEDATNGLLWLSAVVLSLPLLIATFRKLQALGMLLGEMGAKRADAQSRAVAIQAVIANTVPAAGMVGVALFLLLLSSALLPSGRILIALIPVSIGLAVLLWRSCIKIYSKAQFALRETLSLPPLLDEPSESAPLLLKHAQLETVTITETAAVAHKLIREIQLRTNTGAGAVAIERGGETIVNPGPDEELQPGDKVLLLGTTAQLDRARCYLARNA